MPSPPNGQQILEILFLVLISSKKILISSLASKMGLIIKNEGTLLYQLGGIGGI